MALIVNNENKMNTTIHIFARSFEFASLALFNPDMFVRCQKVFQPLDRIAIILAELGVLFAILMKIFHKMFEMKIIQK